MRHGWGRDVWRPPWSKVRPTSKHLHVKDSLSHSQGRSSRGATAHPPSDPRRPPFQGFLELQANDGNADKTGWEIPKGNAEGDAQSLWSHDSDGERFSQSAGHRCYESTEVQRSAPIREMPNSDGLGGSWAGPYPPGKILSVYREEVQEVFVE